MCFKGEGIVVLESLVLRDEFIEFVLDNDEVRIDGNFVIVWFNILDFRVEKFSRSLIGLVVLGEGFVNVYCGVGKIFMVFIV